MLRFFRHIRKGLFDQNPISRYFLYALGEIALVVIGILLALQINTWNQEKQNRILEKEYMIRLLTDLNRDQKEISRQIENTSINLFLGIDALKQLKADTGIFQYLTYEENNIEDVEIRDKKIYFKNKLKKNRNLESFGEQLSQFSGFYSFILTQTTFNDLMSTGNIEVIKDKTIRTKIQEYYNEITTALDFEDIHFYPKLSRYQNTLFELGIPMNSRINLEQVIELVQDKHPLCLAINDLVLANREVRGIAKGRETRIIEISSQIEEYQATL